MFKKINYIRNYSKFLSYESLTDEWKGELKRINVVYAPNGSGKTSLSVMFRSMKGDYSLISKKRAFHSSQAPEILLITNDGKEQKYTKGKWNKRVSDIEIFDSYYIEDNIYLITIENDHDKMNIFELSLKDQVEDLIERRNLLEKKNIRLNIRRKNMKGRIRAKGKNPEYEAKYEEIIQERERTINEIRKIDSERIGITKRQREIFLERVNMYLALFSSDMTITQLMPKTHKIIYNLKINNQLINLEETERYSLKYTLSEGDKNALALSFFMAKIDLIPNLSQFLIVIDDPFTSFDLHRKQTTINHLLRISKKVGQIILLTHDLHFAKDFVDKCEEQIEVIQLKNTPKGSKVSNFDISREALTGIFKDLNVLDDFLNNGAQDDIRLREVVRCIRPVIEGIFRIKYYKYVKQNEWLGDFIRSIRESKEDSPFAKLKPYMDELSDINDYSKIYHHSNPKYLEETINPKELEIFVKRSMSIISCI